MKYIGIDYGVKFVGIAISDTLGRVAMPYELMPNTPDLIDKITELIKEQRIEKIVVGESCDLRGKHNRVQKAIDGFSLELAAHTGLEIYSVNEAFSSRQAKWGIEHALRDNPRNTFSVTKKPEERVDAKAAAIILQSYLDQQLP